MYSKQHEQSYVSGIATQLCSVATSLYHLGLLIAHWLIVDAAGF
jgi:hypothetical protein